MHITETNTLHNDSITADWGRNSGFRVSPLELKTASKQIEHENDE